MIHCTLLAYLRSAKSHYAFKPWYVNGCSFLASVNVLVSQAATSSPAEHSCTRCERRTEIRREKNRHAHRRRRTTSYTYSRSGRRSATFANLRAASDRWRARLVLRDRKSLRALRAALGSPSRR